MPSATPESWSMSTVDAALRELVKNSRASSSRRGAAFAAPLTSTNATSAATTGTAQSTPPSTIQPMLLSNTHIPVANVATPMTATINATTAVRLLNRPNVVRNPSLAFTAMRSMRSMPPEPDMDQVCQAPSSLRH